jgi:pyrimidine operon attenuation protein/uracil phosphoribosyltransferase
MDESSVERTLRRLSREVGERHTGLEGVLLVGVLTRGLTIAQRLAALIGELGSPCPAVASVDVTPYRDDRPRPAAPDGPALRWHLGEGVAAPSIDGATVILIDDVFYTGRTLRAALAAVLQEGRPARVEFLVLVDRGHRELPMRATYVGKNVPTSASQRVVVRLREIDGQEGVWLASLTSNGGRS